MVLAVALQAWMPAPSQPIDSRAAAAARGDRAAAEALLAELLPRVRNLVRYLVRGDRDVDDIAQEALIAIARGLAGYRGEGTITAWADRIAARATFAYLRRERRAVGYDDPGADLASVPHPGDGPDQYAERRQLVRLLDQLPDDQRHALVLHHAMGLSVPEIAESLGISAETVRSRLRLGKGKLRALGGIQDESGSDERSEP
jgi:RNA polymerase sigma-70 factor (ECF subfamily)